MAYLFPALLPGEPVASNMVTTALTPRGRSFWPNKIGGGYSVGAAARPDQQSVTAGAREKLRGSARAGDLGGSAQLGEAAAAGLELAIGAGAAGLAGERREDPGNGGFPPFSGRAGGAVGTAELEGSAQSTGRARFSRACRKLPRLARSARRRQLAALPGSPGAAAAAPVASLEPGRG
ncbi:MAG TPA: hypothetical protein VGW34_04985, partial [Allosphingosinicella sp.]|nr:hypothetical protein [Allosphingosinicella sp.]